MSDSPCWVQCNPTVRCQAAEADLCAFPVPQLCWVSVQACSVSEVEKAELLTIQENPFLFFISSCFKLCEQTFLYAVKELIGIISAWQMKIVCDALTWSPALWRMEKAAQAWLSSPGRSHKAKENSYAYFLLPLRRNWRSLFHAVWAKCFCWVFANFLKLQIFLVEVEPLKLWQLVPRKECFSHSALFSYWKARKQNCVITAKSCPYPWIWDVA